ncbi:hypothetical protein ABZ070_02405 [Streptomyces sp. NPDC006283]|uniref:hypothetical protein n=1 Tax=Streptomyces sp. NPDC006283 TaxID=3156741 RepID=UPI0033A033F5
MAFPQTPLDVLVELLLNGTWTDISQFVYTREPITITAGRTDEGQRVEPSRCQLTLNNRDGRFSARNPMSPYYGQIGRNTPIRVSVPGDDPYLLIDGDSSIATTPDTAALDITGDLDVRIDARLDSFVPGDRIEMCGKYQLTSNQRSWRLTIQDGRIFAGWSTNGTAITEYGSSALTPFTVPSNGRIALRYTLDVNNGLGGLTVTFYTAPTMAGPWTQLSQTVTTTGTTSIYSSTAPLDIGALPTNFVPFRGRVYGFELRSGIGGTVVANPDFTAQTPGDTSFADAAGRTWSLTGTAEITDREPRFTGEVSSWPTRWDVSGEDIWTPIEAAGIMRRLGQGNKALDSTLRRAVPSFEPLAYWPMEEGVNAVQAYSPIAGVSPLKLAGATWAQADTLASSLPLPVLASNTGVPRRMSGAVPAPPPGWTGWQVRWIYRNDDPDSTRWTFMRILCNSGTVRQWFIQSRDIDSYIRGLDADGSIVFELIIGTSLDLFNQWVSVDFHAEQNGGNVDWRVDWQDVGGDAGGGDGSFAGTLGAVTSVGSPEGGFATALDGMAIGHISVWPTTITAAYDGAITGWVGETAADRLSRLASEETRLDIAQFPGDWEIDSQAMGPQRPAELLDLLRECADADGGILYEDRERLALIYRDRASLYNQAPTLSLDYTTEGEVGPPLEPIEDDQRLRNDITVTRTGGSSGRVVIEDGPLSVQAPEDGGVGIYDEAVTLNLDSDDQTEPIAGWRAHLGTWDEARYASVRLMLHAAPHLIPDVLAMQLGDLGVIENPPAHLPPEDIEFLIQGYTEILDQYTWDVVLNATPAGPWRVLELDTDDYSRLDTAGCQLAAGVDADDTSLSLATTDGPVWVNSSAYASDFPFDIRVGGEVMTVTAITGTTSPQTATVTRSVNGIVKSHALGTAVQLSRPVVIPL